MTAPIIAVSNIHKYFGKQHVVNNISLSVMPGEIYGFLGANGSGKTTTIRILCGLLKATSGTGQCVGHPLNSPAIKNEVGYMTQQFSFYRELSVEENLLFVARLYQLSNKIKRVEAIMKRLNLIKRRHQLTGTLSGGWKQRVALAACLLHEPKLLLLDEPTAGVDPEARREFWQHIHRLSLEGITVLVSTHYMDEASHCSRLAYLAQGKLVIEGTVHDIIDHANLVAYQIKGANVSSLIPELKDLACIEALSTLGNSLHIVGHDQNKLQASLSRFLEKKPFELIGTSPILEDAFISLVTQHKVPHDT